MFDGKIFFGVTGTPRRNIAFVNRAFADAEPVPLTFAKRTTKSLILCWGLDGIVTSPYIIQKSDARA
jgi:hypothetical protein